MYLPLAEPIGGSFPPIFVKKKLRPYSFSSKEQVFVNFMAAVTICSNLEATKNEI